jgi:hypothetical protein
MIKKIPFFGLLLFNLFVFSQEDAWVYFLDKENVAASISNPISILSQKAIDRKSKHGITIDSRDVPVNESYIGLLKNASGITVKAKSKWFNAVHVRGTETDIKNLLSNPSFYFIDYIDFADKSLNAKRTIVSKVKQSSDKFKLENTLVNFNYGNTQNQVEMIHANELHLDDYTGDGVTIAVLDASFTNVNTMGAFKRIRDAGDLLGGYDFVDRTTNVYAFDPTPGSISHGTQVLSCMAGFIEDTYVGTAPDASYYLFRTEDNNDENPVEESYWVEAAERADSLGVDIINTSLGYKDYSPNYSSYSYTSTDMNGSTAYITKGANIAFEKGLILVTSAGNSGNSGVGAPADSQYVLSIGAVDASGNYASFSSVGSAIQPSQKPDVVARGLTPYLIDLNNTLVQNNGTSFSGPIMAGGIACLMQALPNKTNAEIMQLVRESGSQYTIPDYQLGFGIPNLYQALEAGLSINSSEKYHSFMLYPNPTSSKLFFELPSDIVGGVMKLYNVLGELVFISGIKQEEPIDVAHLKNGLYIVNLEAGNENKTFKLIKN